MKDNIIRVHFDGLDKHSDDLLAYLEDYQKCHKLTDWQIFSALQYVMCSLFALFLSENDLSSDEKLLKKIIPHFDNMVDFLIKNREGFKNIIINR